MSKRYQQFQQIDQETARKADQHTRVAGPTGAEPVAKGESGHNVVRGISLLILVVVLLTLALAGAMHWFSFLSPEKIQRLAAHQENRDTEEQNKTTEEPKAQILQIQTVETFSGEESSRENVADLLPESDKHQKEQIQTQVSEPESTDKISEVPFITTVEVVTVQETGNTDFREADAPSEVVSSQNRKLTQTDSSEKHTSEPIVAVKIEADKPGDDSDGTEPALQVSRRAMINAVDRKDAPIPEQDQKTLSASDFEHAYNFQKVGQYKKARELYEKYLDKRPNNAPTLNNLGVIFQKQQDYEKAIDAYAKSIAVEADKYRTYNNLAACYIALRRYSAGIEALQYSLKLEPDNYPALVNLGVAYTGLGEYNLAEKYLLQAVKFPQNARGLYNLANLYRCQRQLDKAAQYFRLFLETPDNAFLQQKQLVRRWLKYAEKQAG